jgi:hypothetical protein
MEFTSEEESREFANEVGAVIKHLRESDQVHYANIVTRLLADNIRLFNNYKEQEHGQTVTRKEQ